MTYLRRELARYERSGRLPAWGGRGPFIFTDEHGGVLLHMDATNTRFFIECTPGHSRGALLRMIRFAARFDLAIPEWGDDEAELTDDGAVRRWLIPTLTDCQLPFEGGGTEQREEIA